VYSQWRYTTDICTVSEGIKQTYVQSGHGTMNKKQCLVKECKVQTFTQVVDVYHKMCKFRECRNNLEINVNLVNFQYQR
jgi:hypothetical protein